MSWSGGWGGAYFILTPAGEARRFHLFASAGSFACGLAGRIHAGGWPNVLTPAFAMLAVLLGLGLPAALQLGFRAYDPRAAIAPPGHRAAWDALLTTTPELDSRPSSSTTIRGFPRSRSSRPTRRPRRSRAARGSDR